MASNDSSAIETLEGLSSAGRQQIIAIAEAAQGVVTPQAVVDAARDPSSPLHSYFTWDDAEAADKWRLLQARVAIRAIKFAVAKDASVFKIPAFLSLRTVRPTDGHGGYAAIDRVRSHTDLQREVLVDEITRAVAAIKRAKAIAASFGAQRVLEDAERELASLGAGLAGVEQNGSA